jgi:carbamate kinase
MIYCKNSMEKTAIIALGGNALSNKSQAGTVKDQFLHCR